jgi:hypothetical protein
MEYEWPDLLSGEETDAWMVKKWSQEPGITDKRRYATFTTYEHVMKPPPGFL